MIRAAAFVVAILAAAPSFAQPVPESVYPPPEPVLAQDPQTAQKGVSFDLELRALTDYVWRGIERFDVGKGEDSLAYQIEPRISLDLGKKLPHPYVDVFFNANGDDDISNLQEIRPEIGFDWDIRPLTISAGYTNYIFPDRDGLDTSEVFLRLTLDDSLIFHTEKPLFHPYVFGAFDFDQFDGLYVEAGLQHEFPVEGTGLTFIVNGHVGYVSQQDLFSAEGFDSEGKAPPGAQESGFQHYQLGVTARYRLNELLNIPDRYGQLSVIGFVNYTDGIESGLEATTQLWGGAGIGLKF